MAVAGTGAATSVPVVDRQQIGFGGLTSDTFMKLLIAQLQNQDPLEPVGNEELLSQISMMRNLQSNIELGEAMKSITTNQQLSTAATFIGRAVSGTDKDNNPVSGVVDRAFLRDGAAFVAVGSAEMPVNSIASVGV
ncbi:MAG: flagellar hook capping protein [Planctomycetes bacterium]|nr:flagellar hook capping protein [Planctomycetota bacterium]